MIRTMIGLVSFVLVLGLVSNASAANWTGNGADNLWSTPENWGGVVPTGEDSTRIDKDPGALLVNEGALCAGLNVGQGAPGELTINGGTLHAAKWGVVAGQSNVGVITMESGLVTTTTWLCVGNKTGGEGTFNMYGGLIAVGEGIYMANKEGTKGHMNLYGGTITTPRELVMKENATIDVGGGKLIMDGNDIERVQGYIANGWITAYENYGGGTLHLNYDPNEGKTILTATSHLNPNPTDGGITAPGAVELNWTLPDPCVPGETVDVDVYFTDDRDALANFFDPDSIKLVGQQNVTSVVVQTQPKTVYYWAVDTYIGDPNDPIFGPIFSFTADNQPPQVDAGGSVSTWLVDGVMTKPLDATVTDGEAYTVQWTVVSEPDDPNSADAVIADPSAEDTSITLSALGEYVMQLEAFDGEYTGLDTVTINVYSNGCEAAQSLPDYEPYPGDLNGDCVVDDLDLAILQEDWLKDTSLIEP